MKYMNRVIVSIVIISALSLVTGCGNKAKAPQNDEKPDNAAVTEVKVQEPSNETQDSTPDVAEATPSAEKPTTSAQDESPKAKDKSQRSANPIVWLGDSLTQGSLGDDNDNLPNAPYERLKSLVSVPVTGIGLYGRTTHEVLWAYSDEDHYNQEADPNKTYIFWLGSNDWVAGDVANSNTAPVINEIDSFLDAYDGRINNYIIIGTTSRAGIKDLYIPINNDLKAHYGEHYMDVMDIINKYGYSEDMTHLSQESYDAIADAVYEKLKSLGYI